MRGLDDVLLVLHPEMCLGVNCTDTALFPRRQTGSIKRTRLLQ